MESEIEMQGEVDLIGVPGPDILLNSLNCPDVIRAGDSCCQLGTGRDLILFRFKRAERPVRSVTELTGFMIKDKRRFVNTEQSKGLVRNRRFGQKAAQTGFQEITEFIGQPAGKVLASGAA